jgi:hypothetical protein
MLFSTVIRWELFRLGLAGLARTIAFDSEPTSADRSRSQHLRNGLGALLFVWSDVGLRGNRIASLLHAATDPARSTLRYGVSELRRSEPWTTGRRFAGRHQLALLAVTSAGLGVAGQALGRTR